MKSRLSKKMITFDHPFDLDEIEATLPAGSYTIETEEESLNGASFLTTRSIGTTLVVRPPRGKPGRTEYWEINPEGLAAAQARDQALTASSEGADSKAIAAAIEASDPAKTPHRLAMANDLAAPN